MMYPQRADAAARRVDSIVSVLRLHDTIEAALPVLRERELAHSEDAIRMALRRAGKGKPDDHLGADYDPPTLQGGFHAEAINDESPVRDWIDLAPESPPAMGRVVQAIAFFPDIHAGFHDERAISCGIKIAELGFADFPIEQRHVVQLGDLLDNDSISAHPRSNLPPLTFQQEVAEGRRILSRLEAIDAGKYSLCLGNHDFWIEKHKLKKCPEFAHLISVDKLLELESHGWDWVPYHRHFTIGRTHVSHEFGRCGANAATAGLNSAVGKVFGHSHRMCVTYGGLTEDFFRVSAMLGCLVRYEHANYGTDTQFVEQWCQGIGFGYLDDKGFLWLQPVPIINGRAIFNGKMVQA